ncbi:hypothetical protein Tco_1344823 [Tanacetum coccineum]
MGEKDCFMPKGIKQSPLEKVLLKSVEKYIHFSLKDCTCFAGSNSKEMESEVTSTRDYEFAQDTLVKSSSLAIIIRRTLYKPSGGMHAFWSLNGEISRYCSDNLYAVSIKEDMAYLCLHFTRNHEELKSDTSYPDDSIRRIEDYLKILEDIERGPYSKKPLICRIDLNQYDVSMNFHKL